MKIENWYHVVNAFPILQINSGPKVARWHSKEPCSGQKWPAGTQGVKLNTDSPDSAKCEII